MQGALDSVAEDADRPASGAARRPEILCLTALRSVAALEVVLFHTLFELGGKPVTEVPSVVVALLTQGGAAVSFFFVLSGFILAYTYTEDGGMKGAPRKFWRARFARIYPLYALGFALDAPRVVSFFIDSTSSLGAALAKICVAGLAYLTLLQSWHPRVANTWNTPGWSLSTEAFFYAVFPALQGFARRWSFLVLLVVVVATWFLQVIAYGALTRFHVVDATAPNFVTFWRSFPPFRLPEFSFGLLSGRLLLGRCFAGRQTLVRWSAVAALALILLVSARPGLVPDALEVSLLAPLFAVLIFALASGALPTFEWLNGRVPVLLGRASYAVYILHQPLKTAFLAIARGLGLGAPSPSLLLSYLVCLELLCVALYYGVEDPLRRVITRAPRGSSRQ